MLYNFLEDEIVSIEPVSEGDTIDIEVDNDNLFFANDILTHNSAVTELEVDHSHIAGGISKINTADNVVAIYTSDSLREQGEYRVQFLKTRSSSGVGSKVYLGFSPISLRIFDKPEGSGDRQSNEQLVSELKNKRKSQSEESSPVIKPKTLSSNGPSSPLATAKASSKLSNIQKMMNVKK